MKTILLVEDDAALASGERERLESRGYRVLRAASGKEAVALAGSAEEAVDLVLMDLDLGPGLDGAEAASEIVSAREVPVLFLTSDEDEAAARKADGIAHYGYADKGSGAAALDASIKTALRLFESLRREKAKEAALAEREEQLGFAIEGSGAGLWDWRMDTDELVVNDRWLGILGYAREGVSPIAFRTFAGMTHPEDLARSDQVTADYLAGRIASHSIELRMRHRDGRWVWILDNGKITERDSAGKPIRMSGMHFDITERKRDEERIKALLAEKDLILREVHHRLKNNMNTIYSLLSLQADASGESAVVSALEDAKSRVRSMLVLYDRLYQPDVSGEQSIERYLDRLVEQAVRNFPNGENVKIEKCIDDFSIDSKRLQSIGILVNELLTNIMKYAFAREGDHAIFVSASTQGANAVLAVQDNGAGIPESIDFESSGGFGFMLVSLLAKQLAGTIRIERGEGTRIVLEFPM